MIVRASPPRIGPRAARRSRSVRRASAPKSTRPRKSTKTRSTQQSGRRTATIGIPIFMKSTKLTSRPASSRAAPAKMRLGGVPRSVPTPPMDAE
jgi:hypothetical protein